MAETRKSYCRFCHAYCAIDVDIEQGRVVAVRGDRTNPMYGGYTCIKGRQLPEALAHPDRLRRPLRRRPDGSFDEISSRQALDEIAERVERIVREHGPRAIASYNGTYAFQESSALAVSRAFHKGLDSPSFYTSVTIDQPAKIVAMGRLGVWGGGPHSFESADVVLLIGNNPLVSVYSPVGGIPPYNPFKRLRQAQRSGLRVICVDPRRTEVARRADLHLQVRPGEDPMLLAGMLRTILSEQLHDQAFCDDWVQGVDALRDAVADFDPGTVERRTGVPAAQSVEAARLFARGPRGTAVAGTGPDMAPHPNLTEHLVAALNTVLGRYNRAGERVANPGVLAPPQARKAQAYSPRPGWGRGPRSRVRGLGQLIGEMPTAALSDEILLPGEGQVRALFAIGGNPVAAWPDQLKTLRAMQALELLVSVDVKLSATAKRAHYVIPAKMCLERDDVPLLNDSWYPEPYSHYAEALVQPDPGVMEEWEFYWELARRLGTPLPLPGGELDLEARPSKFDVLEKVTARSRVPLAQLRERARDGHVFDEIEVYVDPADPGHAGRLDVGPGDVLAELRCVRDEPEGRHDGFTHRLISRRLPHVYNSSGQELPALRERGTTNPAFMSPDDLASLGLASGDLVEIESDHARILGVVEASDELRSGVVSMAHAWGDGPEQDARVREIGSSTNRLVSNARDYDPITGMARQSAIPVRIRRVTGR
jgi:anaerobic selenocysteine-containing dehydrogenase